MCKLYYFILNYANYKYNYYYNYKIIIVIVIIVIIIIRGIWGLGCGRKLILIKFELNQLRVYGL